MKSVVLLALLLGFSPVHAGQGAWIGEPEVSRERTADGQVRGVVFDDRNRDGRRQDGEPGVPGVKVSNGLDVVVTDADGAYTLAVRPDMNLTVVQPSGWRTPVDHRQVPQFFHIHKESGSPDALRFGGLPASGPAPARVNFPLVRSDVGDAFSCAVIGDSQTYSNTEVGYFRDSTIAEILQDPPGAHDCLLYVGDVVGDDLGLLERLLEIGSVVGIPQYLTHGNHDLDFDATSDADSADSWRRIYGPEYFAFEMGQVLFVVLDNVVYPCGPADMAAPGREFCESDTGPTYNGRVTPTQMTWLENLLALTPRDKLVVLSHHIPFVSFVDARSRQHQTDDLARIHALLEGRPALSLAGHTHTTENHAPGQYFAGWEEAVGVGPLPFRHIIAGAASGAWFQGDLDVHGVPMALQRMGEPKGFLQLDFSGAGYVETYRGAQVEPERRQWLSFNTPDFRAWYDAILGWSEQPPDARSAHPPLSVNDLTDTRMFTPDDLDQGVWLTANVWIGDAGTTVTAAINEGPAVALERTQAGDGDAVRIGAEWADPFATVRQLSIARVATQSESGEERNQGVEVFKGMRFGPHSPRPMTVVANRNSHLWRLRLPTGLPEGVHVVTVTTTDRHQSATVERIAFEVRADRPAPRWRSELWSGN